MTRQRARVFLRRLSHRYIDWLYRVGDCFVFGKLLPALRALDPGTPRDGPLLAVCHNFVGDLWDLSDAPRAAARAYRRAARCDPRNKWAWAELGNMLVKTGQYRAALRALRRAGRLPGDSATLEWYIEEAVEGIRDREPPWFRGGARLYSPAPGWDVCELLARNRPRDALRLLRGRRHPYLRQLRARVFGALEDASRAIEEWERITATKGKIELEHGDWFFLPHRVWDDPRFWRALYALRNRFDYGWSKMHAFMDKIVPEPRYRRGSKAAMRRHRRRMTIWLRFHIARTEKDAAAARRLAQRYPGWRRAETLARKLTVRRP